MVLVRAVLLGSRCLGPGDVDALNRRCGSGSWVVSVEPQGSLVGTLELHLIVAVPSLLPLCR